MGVAPKALQGGMVSLVRRTTEPLHGFFAPAARFKSTGDDKLGCRIIGFGFGENWVYLVRPKGRCELPANDGFQRVK
jgi:hypothetical protein